MASAAAAAASAAPTLPSYVALVTGANRGLGLEFVRQLLQSQHNASSVVPADVVIVATARNPDKAEELAVLQQEAGAGRLHILALEATDLAQMQAVAEFVANKLGRLDLLINNAGMGEENIAVSPSTLAGQEALSIMHTNAIAPVLLTQALLPTLHKTAALRKEQGEAKPFPRVVFLSTRMSSISYTTSAIAPSYRASKAALNMYVRCFSNEDKALAFLILHPGWAQTDLGLRVGSAPITPKASVEGCLARIAEMSMEQSGASLVSYDGTSIPW